MNHYSPTKIQKPKDLIEVPSAWKGLESILGDVVERFCIKKDKCLEFGVEYGYSTVALSNYFTKVIGVDHFKGDQHTENGPINFEAVKELLAPYPIQLYNKSYQDYIKENYMNGPYDLIHIDIVHTYEDTLAAGEWALKQAPVVIFHDTESFPEVRRAVEELSKKCSQSFNYPFNHGLGILCR